MGKTINANAETSAIFQGKRGGEGRVVCWPAMYLYQVVGRYSLTEIAEQFGIRHIIGVTHQTRKLKQGLEGDLYYEGRETNHMERSQP